MERQEDLEEGDEYDVDTGVAAPSLKNAEMALAAFPKEEVGEGEELSDEDVIASAMSQKNPMDDLMSNLGTADITTITDKGAMLGGHIGNQEGGPVGALLGASMGGVLSRAYASKQSGESDLLTKYATIMKGLSGKEGVPLLAFSDGSVFELPTDPSQELPLNQKNVLDGKDTRTSVEIDSSYPIAIKTSKKVVPIAKHLVENVYQYKTKDSKTNKKLVDYLKGAITNSIISDGAPSDVIDLRISELAAKFKMVM